MLGVVQFVKAKYSTAEKLHGSGGNSWFYTGIPFLGDEKTVRLESV